MDPGVVAAALTDIGRRLRSRFGAAPGPVTFYVWYDRQAGQLRCSLGAAAFDALPFGGRYRVVERPALLAADPHPGVVPWHELADGDEDQEVDPEPFPVFAVRITADRRP